MSIPELATSTDAAHPIDSAHRPQWAAGDRWLLLLLTLLGGALRLWRLDSLGLSYDEAATALMARARVGEIIAFHWTAGFEHPPLWQLMAHGWSRLAGQSEYALRFLPALAGVLVIPLIWQLARRLYPSEQRVPQTSAALAAVAPVLVYYSQEARMYAPVLVLALGSMIAALSLWRRPSWRAALGLAALNILLTGFHYYAALILVAQALFFVAALAFQSTMRRHWMVWGAGLLLSGLPLGLWMAFSPGFRLTVGSVMAAAAVERTPMLIFLDALWRDMSVAAIRWQPGWAWAGYLLIPLLLLGLADALWLRPQRAAVRGSSWYLLLLFLGPLLFSMALFGGLSTRYVLYIVPPLLIFIALGIDRLATWARPLGALGGIVVVGLFGAALIFYGTVYAKSEYREMSAYLQAHLAPDDGILLESPRQHLSAKYYLAVDNPIYPVPSVDLSPYWPVTAPPVVPEEVDGEIQAYLRRHPRLWLSLTAQDEVDLGEFVPKYLAAVAYPVDCERWLDVDLCQYVSPQHIEPQASVALDATFDGGLTLQRARITPLAEPNGAARALLAQLDWVAREQPHVDYKVSLRLLDSGGAVLAQTDGFPIGPLLPPSTWRMGDEKPGYMALLLPTDIQPGTYRLAFTLYAPDNLETVPYQTVQGPPSTEPLVLANVRIDDTIQVELASGTVQ